jgi:hypothetical protein
LSPNLKALSTSFFPSGILVELEARDLDAFFNFVNLYGPYVDKKPLWESLDSFKVLSTENLILGGELNFTLSLQEVWCAHPHRNPLEYFCAHLLESSHLVDLEPFKLSPTWKNGRKSVEGISKHIDKFPISEALVEGPWTLKSWVGSGSLLNHMPIILNLESKELKPHAHLKFNHV